MIYRLLADLILVVHTSFIAFVIFGLVLTLLGGWRGWQWVHNRWFRIAHLAAIGVVVLQAWLGVACPLTIWENWLRARGGEQGYPDSFIAYWLHQVIFYTWPTWVFTTIYTAFGLLVAATFWFVPVHWRPCRDTRQPEETDDEAHRAASHDPASAHPTR